MICQALRSLLRARAFSVTVVLTVALAIGVNTAVFSVIYSLLLDPLPYRDPARLVHVAETHPEFPSFQVAAPDYVDWRRMSHSFEDMAAHTFQAMNQTTLLGHGEPERVQAVNASCQLFPMLGIQPVLGRTFSAEEEAKQAPVVLLSEALWRRKFSADPSVAGRTIRLGSAAFANRSEEYLPPNMSRRFPSISSASRFPGLRLEAGSRQLLNHPSKLRPCVADQSRRRVGAPFTPARNPLPRGALQSSS